MRRTRLLVVAPAALLLLAGCGLGPNAPRPGVAAEVDGTVLSLSQLDDLVDAVCIRNADDPQGQPTSRGLAAQQMVEQWTESTALIEYADRHHLPGDGSAEDLSKVPGWDRMDQSQRDALASFAKTQEQADAISQAAPNLKLDPADFHVVFNPRFDLALGPQGFERADNHVSVAVSKQAKVQGGQLTAQQASALPASQLCGRLPGR